MESICRCYGHLWMKPEVYEYGDLFSWWLEKGRRQIDRLHQQLYHTKGPVGPMKKTGEIPLFCMKRKPPARREVQNRFTLCTAYKTSFWFANWTAVWQLKLWSKSKGYYYRWHKSMSGILFDFQKNAVSSSDKANRLSRCTWCLCERIGLLLAPFKRKRSGGSQPKSAYALLLLPRQFYGATLSSSVLYSLEKACLSKIYAEHSLSRSHFIILEKI